MNFGWVDFSENDRQKTLDFLKILDEPSAVDELGLGVIRDFFADIFFPATSTIQTRAKYFIIVPQLIKSIINDKKIMSKITEPKNFISQLRFRELQVAYKLSDSEYKKSKESEGIIGESLLSKFNKRFDELELKDEQDWIVRTPSEIYWAGLRLLKIYQGDLSLQRYVDYLIKQYKNQDKNDVSLENKHHDSENDVFLEKNCFNLNLDNALPNKFSFDNIKIKLDQSEAEYLYEKFSACHTTKDNSPSIFSCILKKFKEGKIDLSDLDMNLDSVRRNDVLLNLSDTNKKYLEFAINFDKFTYPLKILYNYCIFSDDNYQSDNKKEKLEEITKYWDGYCENLLVIEDSFIEYLTEIISFESSKNLSPTMNGTLLFLKKCQDEINKLKNNGSINTFDKKKIENFVCLKEIISEREKNIKKTARRIGKKDVELKLYGINHYDYRLRSAMVIIKDILASLPSERGSL